MSSGIRWTEEMLAEFQAGVKRQREKATPFSALRAAEPPPTGEPGPARQKKYKNIKATVDGVEFDSRKEARRWVELSRMQAAGEIYELRRQVTFELAPAARLSPDFKQKPAIRFIADFVYVRDGKMIVEDTKSVATRNLPVYRLKKHLLFTVHGLQVHEV